MFFGEKMSRYTGPKNRIARKLGANVFGKARNPLLHKPNPPGMHGTKRKKKSDYGMQLEEKQKLIAAFGMITQRQLLHTYKKARKKQGNLAHNFLEMLECRLDNIVYRLRFAPTIFAAQQLVNHGHIFVDGKKVDIRSFQVRPGMTITLKEKTASTLIFKASIENTAREIPEYLSLESSNSGKLLVSPKFDQVPLPIVINMALVCDFLAHSA